MILVNLEPFPELEKFVVDFGAPDAPDDELDELDDAPIDDLDDEPIDDLDDEPVDDLEGEPADDDDLELVRTVTSCSFTPWIKSIAAAGRLHLERDIDESDEEAVAEGAPAEKRKKSRGNRRAA